MPKFTRRGPVIRDTVISSSELKEGEMEIAGKKQSNWMVAGEDIAVVPTREVAENIHGALKEALRAQLEAEAGTIGDIGPVAIHGRTGVST